MRRHSRRDGLRRISPARPWLARVWDVDRVLAAATDNDLRLSMLIKRGRRLLLTSHTPDEDESLSGLYSSALVAEALRNLRTSFLPVAGRGVFLDFLDGVPPAVACALLGHLNREGGCTRCGLPGVIRKRRRGLITWPFPGGGLACDWWPKFFAPATSLSGF